MTTYAFTVSKDEEVLETLQRAVAEAGIQHARVSLIGAIHECTVSVMRKSDALDDLPREYDQPFELTGPVR